MVVIVWAECILRKESYTRLVNGILVCAYMMMWKAGILPYMGLGEFYCDYGNFEYYITAPAEMIVYGSGDLQNPAQVLTPNEINRLGCCREK